MQKILISLFTILLLSTGCSCKKDAPILLCPSGFSNLDFEEINLTIITNDSEKEYVINDDSTYQAVFQPSIDYDSTFVLPFINFSQSTILGKYAVGVCRDENFIRKTCVNHKQKEYIYIVRIKSGETCFKPFFSMNWVIVPKIPNDYTIKFDIKT